MKDSSRLSKQPSASSGQEVVAEANWWEGNGNEQTENKSVKNNKTSAQRKNNKNKSTPKTKSNDITRPRSRSRSRSFMSRTPRNGADTSSASTETTEQGRSPSRGRSPGKNRRRSLSLGRRRSRSQSRSRSDEHGHYAPTPTADAKPDGDDDEEEDDGFDDDDDVQVINELGLPSNLPPNDDFLEEDYDPDKHGARDDFSLSCGTCNSDFAPVSLSSLLQDLLEESKAFCTSMCGTSTSDGHTRTDRETRCSRPMPHIHCGRTDSTTGTVESGDSLGQNNNDDEDSRTLATNDVPLKMEEGHPGMQMRRCRSGSRNASKDQSTTAPANAFSTYGDDDRQERGRSMSRTRSSPSKRSKSMERKLAKWKMARRKMKNKELKEEVPDEPIVASPKSVAEAMTDETDWRVVRDDVLSKYESGHFVTYEAGRVRSSTKRCSSRATGQEGEEKMERFLYM